MSYYSFEDLDVWKKSCSLAVDIYTIFKDCKDFSFKDQVQRAAVSIASNIAEGAERGSLREFIRFLHIAKGSASELRTQLYIANRVNLLNEQNLKEYCNRLIEISKMIHALIASLSNRKLKT